MSALAPFLALVFLFSWAATLVAEERSSNLGLFVGLAFFLIWVVCAPLGTVLGFLAQRAGRGYWGLVVSGLSTGALLLVLSVWLYVVLRDNGVV